MRVDRTARRLALGGAFGLFALGLFLPASSQVAKKPKPPKVTTFAKDVRPLVTRYCVSCHSGASPAAGLALDKDSTEALVKQRRDVWDKVAENLASGHMPPQGLPAPTKAQRSEMVAWIRSTLTVDCRLADPGRVTMRRMNRQEYNNTVRDLTGLDLKLADDFPSDDVGYGFDNIGDVLSISPLLMEKYLSAAEKIASQAVYVPPKPSHYEGDDLRTAGGGSLRDSVWAMNSTGGVQAIHDFPHPGTYIARIRAYGQQAGPEPTKMTVRLDKDAIAENVEVKETESAPGTYEYPIRVTSAGKHSVSASFMNDYYVAGPPMQDRNFFVHWIEIAPTPVTADGLPESHKRIFAPGAGISDPHKAAANILKAFATRAYRRPATQVEVERLTQIVDLLRKDGESFEEAVRVGVQAVLSSPNFLFRVEQENGKAALSGYELASRLSYFLWASMPDDRLLNLAGSGELVKPAILSREAKRMLVDPRSKSLADGFAAQWLNLRKLSTIVPDPKMFPEFDDTMRDSMLKETKLFFDGVVRNDRSVLDFLVGDYSYVNGKLANLYGIPGVEGDEFRKVSLAGTPRAGVLTQGSVLTLTSNPTRTSPTKRGKWVLDELLDQPPPPAPPGVGLLEDPSRQLQGDTLRKRMEDHRKNPACATCHMRMDPLGFSLENFDAIGKWRTKEGTVAIDASGELPGGVKFTGPKELRKILLTKKGEFVRCLSEKLLTYAIGRGVESSDQCYVDSISTAAAKSEYRFSALVSAVVTSDAFRIRKAASKGAK